MEDDKKWLNSSWKTLCEHYTTGNVHVGAASGAILAYNLSNWNKDSTPSDIIWNSTKIGLAGLVGAEAALIAGAYGGLLVFPVTYGTARALGFEHNDAMIGSFGATAGFAVGDLKNSGPSSGSGNSKGGRYNDAGTWDSE